MERRICPKCGSPQQWEMWQLCACGYDFGSPEPKVRIANSEQTGKTVMQRWLDGNTPAQAIRALRLRILWSWGAMLALAAAGLLLMKTDFGVFGILLIFLAPVVAYFIRLRTPAPLELGSGFALAVVTLSNTFLATIRPLGRESSILFSLCAVTFVLLVIEEVRNVRKALQSLSTGSSQADASPISTQDQSHK
jgi:hypothetical protein